MANDHRGIALCYTAIFLLSLNGLFANTIALDAVSMTQLRSVVAIVALGLFCLCFRRSVRLSSWRDAGLVYLVGILMGLHWVTFFHSMQISGVAVGMLSLYTFPVITVLMEPFFNRQNMRLKDIVAACMVVVGILIIASEQLNASTQSLMLGVAWGVASAFFYTLRNLLQKYRLPKVSSDGLMFHQLIIIAAMLLVFVDIDQVLVLSLRDQLLLVLLGVLTTAGAHTLLIAALKRLPAKTVAMIGCMQPVIGAIFAWLLLNEALSLTTIAGGAIILSVAIYESLQKVETK